ncbi:hypothetical protein ILUMI_13437 [Ignelater luminosus]|uniref:Uncharacterized protein n=1 Tax=Ignelater luminosus TaxID=2038154 RepID=A0A8K0G8N7_IGNLU|nr:hypothetical protein ILUMI_13437 [Ignelater luminosus]
MKVCLVLLSAFCGVLAGNLTLSDIRKSWKGPEAPFMTECVRETHANPQLLVDFFENGILSDDPYFKCLIKCIQIKLNVMSSSGEVDAQAAVSIYPHLSLQLVQKCTKNLVEPDLCHRTYLIAKCVNDALAKRLEL